MRAAVFFLSAAVLAHEVSLLRVLSLAYWHHAASLAIAVALLAFGVAGTLLAVARRLERAGTVAVCAALYAVAIPLSLRAVDLVDFNVLEVGWDATQWLRLLALETILLLAFLPAALGIAVALALHAERPGALYAANLIGSGAGALAAPLLASLALPGAGLQLVAVVAALAALPLRRPLLAISAAAAALLLGGVDLKMSPFKDWMALPGKKNISTWHGPLGRVDRAELPALHYAPGLSLMAPYLPEEQSGLFVDGHLVGALDRGDTRYLDHTTGALPFAVAGAPPREVALLGVGPDLARATLVVDPDANLLEAAGVPLEAAGVSGVAGVVSRPRAFLEETERRYDLIVHHLPALHAAAETPLLTVEGLRLALDRAGEAGLAVSCALATPPRAGLKLLATAERVTPHLIAVRSADRLCVLLRRRPPTGAERERILAFCDENGFDPVRPDAWRFDEPYYETRTPLRPPGPDYPYDVRPATDARPYFFKFFRWSRLGDLFDPEQISFVQWPYVALLVAFFQVTLLSLLLMAAPLLVSRAARAPARLFLALGFGFMFLEMCFLQRAMALLASPVQAAAAVLGGFLVGAGLGSLAGERLGRPLRRAALAVVLVAPAGFLLLPRSPLGAALVCMIVALPMGIPFPAALSRLPARSVAWALAWNGCASVSAAAAAPLLSSTFAIPATGGLALLLYVLVAWRP